MTPFRAVLFDFAGTVMMPVAAPAWVAQAAARITASVTEDEIAALAQGYLHAGLPGGPYPDGVPDDVAHMYAVRDLGPDEHRAAYMALLSSVPEPVPGFTEAMYEEVLGPEGWVAYPDAVATVNALQAAGLRVGLISNIGYEIRPILAAHGLDALAQRCTLSCEHRIMKPDTRLFAAALAQVQAQPADTLMVGDHAAADTGGVALGMRTLVLPMTPPGAPHGLDAVLDLALPRSP
jgi:FMN phosphatase YigB (HAD superfamily)